ncbi:hypothetical protein L4D20_05295 [Vibrio kyushuensis]|uniref:DUF4376 domain-containing protein n=1 Tax=Vibrio kyushuensis TaxID=2910249 RepID=UPI003D14E65F
MQKHYAKGDFGISEYRTNRKGYHPDGLIEMQGPPPHSEWIANEDGTYTELSPVLDLVKSQKQTELKTACDLAITEQRFTSLATGTALQYRCRIVDQLNLSGYTQGGSDHNITTYANDDAEPVRVLHTPAQFSQLRTDMTDHIEVRKEHLWDLKAQVNAIVEDTPENREKLENIVWDITFLGNV